MKISTPGLSLEAVGELIQRLDSCALRVIEQDSVSSVLPQVMTYGAFLTDVEAGRIQLADAATQESLAVIVEFCDLVDQEFPQVNRGSPSSRLSGDGR